MKNFYILVLQCFVGVAISHAQYTAIADPAFEATLGFLGYDDTPADGQVPTANIINVKELVLNNTFISSLAGIEDFRDLTSLEVSDTNIGSIDVSTHTLLENLKIDNCSSLKTIVFGENKELIDLSITGTLIEHLDLSPLESLTEINLSSNNLSYLNVQTGTSEFINNFNATNNPNLNCIVVDGLTTSSNWADGVDNGVVFSETYCRYTIIPDVNFEAELERLGYDDISGDGQVPTALIANIETLALINRGINDLTGIQDFTALKTLRADRNNIQSLDVSHNLNLSTLVVFGNNLNTLILGDISLATLRAENNQLTKLDLRQNTALQNINLSNNLLINLNIKNDNNTNITGLNTTGNASLTCITVDDTTYAQTNFTSVDDHVTFSNTACTQYTYIPDANFETALSTYDDISSDHRVPTANIRTELFLNIEHSNVSDITGLEDFKALVALYADGNTISNADFSHNLNLIEIDLAGSPISNLNIENNTKLFSLILDGSLLTTLDISGNTKLIFLQVRNSSLTEIDLTHNPDLRLINLINNNLTKLNVKNGNNTKITRNSNFNISNNPNLTCVFVDDAAYSTTNWTNIDSTTTFRDGNYCEYTQVPDIAFETALENLGYDDVSGDGQVPTANIETVKVLFIQDANISDLTGIEDFTALKAIFAEGNHILEADFSNNLNLEDLDLRFSPLQSLDIESNIKLVQLLLDGSVFTTLNLSRHTDLRFLTVRNSSLTGMNLTNNPKIEIVRLDNSDISYLNLKNGHNNIITHFNTTGTANLTCIAVDDVNYSTNFWKGVDPNDSFTDEYCRYTSIPDANFEARLGVLDYDDISDDGQVPTAIIENVTNLQLRDQGITDMTGIQDFTSLEVLSLIDNSVDSLNVSNAPNLRILQLRNNSVSTIDLSNNPNLVNLLLENNGVKNIDLSNNLAIEELYLAGNELTSVDLSSHTALKILGLGSNNLVNLNVKNGNNDNMTTFALENNPKLTCIAVDNVSYAQNNFTRVDDHVTFSDTPCTQYTHIPDANFETALSAYDDISNDNRVPTANIETITTLDIRSNNITDLTGIAAFTALTELRANFNLLTSIDIRANTALETLSIGNNSLTHIDVSSNVNLKSLSVNDLDLSAAGIDISNNTQLTHFDADNSKLSGIDLSNNTALIHLDLSENPLTSLNITDLSNLEDLILSDTSIPTMDFSNNSALDSFTFSNTSFTSLNLSGLSNLTFIEGSSKNNELSTLILSETTALKTIQLSRGNISSLDLSDAINLNLLSISNHQIQDLDLSNNTALETIQLSKNDLASLDLRNIDLTQVKNLNFSQNPNLSCVSVDDVAYARVNFSSNISYSIGCGQYTYIPDNQFEAALSLLDDIPNDNYIPTAGIANLTSIDISNSNIVDLTGIEDFASLTTLNASGNALKIVDFSANTILKNLNLENNQINLINFSNLRNLKSLDVSDNELLLLTLRNSVSFGLTDFDATNNPNLKCIIVDSEAYANAVFTNIDSQTRFSEIACNPYISIPDTAFETALENLGYDDISNDNQIPLLNIYDITSLDVENQGISDLTGIEYFANLKVLNCSENLLSTIDLSSNLKLEDIDCDKNSFVSLDFSKNFNLIKIDADQMSSLTSIDFTGCEFLQNVEIDDNSIESIDFTTNTSLYVFDLDNNSISTIDLSKNRLLISADLSYNSISDIDITENTLLKVFNIEGNSISSIDFSKNTRLIDIEVDNTQVVSLDFTNNLELKSVDIDDNPLLTSVVFGNANALSEIYADVTAIETIDVSMLPLLQTLDLGDTNLKALDISSNRALSDLRVDNAALEHLNVKNGYNSRFTRMNTTGNPNLSCILVDDIVYSTNNWINIDPQHSFSEISCTTDFFLALKVYLQGASLNPNVGEETLMRDDLRVGGLIPTTSPYADGLTCDASVLNTTGDNAIVDWIWIELSDKNNPTTVNYSRSALIQRDGDIVDVDGTSLLSFSTIFNSYYIAVKHRNHLNIRSSNPITFSTIENNSIDFTNTISSIEGGLNAIVDLGNSRYALISGDFDENKQIQNTDTNAIIQLLGLSGYNKADLNMNGQVQNSDVNTILNTNIGKGEQF
ncbi:hypothetical protein [Tenacibaculum agarivorans]|uniref:hypothetical protein n=1 Tax=Tenacibaculum agarivorans TaxID=1908389 RepID=UPI00094BB951|nr:hypothetical protein [Tenacibaculum agarivorans]